MEQNFPNEYVNDDFYFNNHFATTEMFLQFNAQLSSCLPCQFVGKIVYVDEVSEFNSLMESVNIEDSKGRFLFCRNEYRPKV